MKLSSILVLAFMLGCALIPNDAHHKGLYVLRWVETPNPKGPSTAADPADVVHFNKFTSYEQGQDFAAAKALLREGDVIAYTKSHREVTADMVKGGFNSIGYGLLEYGHLAIIVQDDSTTGGLRMFSSQSFLGPNTKEDIDTLAKHNWDAYRLDQWDRVNTGRLNEFVRLAEEKAGNWYGYDFSGMFALWNSNLTPSDSRTIGRDYICSTIVLAALYYSGVQLDAVRNGGYLDLCSPRQVVTSPGRLARSRVTLEMSEKLTAATVELRDETEWE